MTSTRTYLDYNASSPLRPEARAAVIAALDANGNPSSVHAEGRRARAIVDQAREKVAALVGAEPSEVVFTSGATEANNWVVKAGWIAALVPTIEHDSVLEPAVACNGTILWPAGGPHPHMGFLQSHLAEHARRQSQGQLLVALQLANNETGIVHSVGEVAALASEVENAWVHTDAVQGAGRIAIDFRTLGVHSMVLSSHKIGGPQGVGALIVRGGANLPAFIAGGGQEKRKRAGTENVAAIAGFGAAAEAAARDLADMPRLAALRDRLEREAKRIAPETIVVGGNAARLPNTSCIADPWRSAETMVIAFDLAGVAVSSGAACSSGKVGRSRVLESMSLPRGIPGSSIRVSLGWATTDEDIDVFLAAWAAVTARGRSSAERALASGS
jgi:cysteine desulfurase